MTRPARVVRSVRARQDLIEIWTWIAADALLDRIDAACQSLSHAPFLGAPRDDIRKGLRHFVVRPYVLLYRATRTEVTIVRVVHGRRDLHGLSRRRSG